MTTATASRSEDVPWRIQGAVYGIGLFSTSIFHIGAVIVPLYAATMTPSPLMFGLVFSAAHFLPLFLSIHTGALMDRLGARRVMLVCTAIGAIVPLLYPAFPWIWALVFLQMFFGLSESMGWLGAQTMIGQYMYGKTVYAGRMSFIIRIGHLVVRAARRHQLGPRRAVGRLRADVAVGLRLGGVRAAAAEAAGRSRGAAAGRTPREGARAPAQGVGLSDRVPAARRSGGRHHRAARRADACRQCGAGLVLCRVAQRHGPDRHRHRSARPGGRDRRGAVLAAHRRGSCAMSAACGSRCVSLWSGILLVCATPLFGSYFLLQMAMFLRSGANGLAQPLVITLVLRGAGRENQGKAIGLRGTANRVASIISPLAMGAIAEAVGLERSFYVVGALVSVVMIGIAIYLWRNPQIAKAGED